SLNDSLYFARKSIIGFMFTSLNVVNIAVSFLTVTNRFAIVLRKADSFWRRSLREPALTGAAATAAAGLAASTGFACDACAFAFSASSLVMRPSLPVPAMEAG